MSIKTHCQHCNRKTTIKYGTFKLQNGQSVQRLLCTNKSCRKTSCVPSKHNPFFNRMRLPDTKLHQAVEKYRNNESISSIAKSLGVHPNTIIKWLDKIFKAPYKYKSILVDEMNYSQEDAIQFFKDSRHTIQSRLETGTSKKRLSKIRNFLKNYTSIKARIQPDPSKPYKHSDRGAY